ncbi:sulfatase-like hydrolase/transferase [Ruminococcaceae bacterium OttesenSCG-928-L11]|nr:sulfatase-like hydrolase/transferase [Ruminococcaceae bacterium OttesenSCG-928-L11]
MSERRPNIVYILNDHQAFYGHTQAKRPVFESFARQGVEFENAYTVCPLCGPARRSMLTGLFPHNHGEKQNDDDHPFDKELYLDILAQGGYDCRYVGKWHAGLGTALDHGCTGFNYPSYNNPYTKAEYRAYLEELGLDEPEVFIEHYFWEKDQGPDKAGQMLKQDGNWCNEHASGVMLAPKEAHESFFLAHLAKKQLRELAGSDKPFHLRLDFWGPHQPYFPTRDFAGLYRAQDISLPTSLYENVYENDKPEIYRVEHNKGLHDGAYNILYPSALAPDQWRQILARCYAQITQVDAAAGIVLDALDELGLAQNTLVIMTTDHGDAVACHGGHFDKASYMPEEMIRIPMAIRYPGVVSAGERRADFVSNLDAGPTILDAAGLDYPQPVDGHSLLDIFRTGKPWREYIVCETHGHWGNHIGRALITRDYKLIFNENQVDELYDLRRDPWELRNLAVRERYAPVYNEMLALLRTWGEETGDSALLAVM